VLPDDTQTGWSMLSPDFQSEVGSYEDYDGFWSTIDSVTVEDVEAVGPDAVDTTLVYTTGGSSQTEVRRIELTESDGSYLISGDAVVG
jgi:eukaryotic-like serine/threonine-protein kinase